ncbi:MAG: metallophosphoesterase [Bacteroidota bacterium]|jgi:predicted phosphodiesterase
MLRKIKYFVIIIGLFLVSKNLEAKIIMKPYLQGVSQNRIYIMAECDDKIPVEVEFWDTDSSNHRIATTTFMMATDNNQPTFVHRIILDSLMPDREYKYKTSQNSQTIEGGTFRTTVSPGSDFSFAIFGDCRSNPKVASKLSELIKKQDPYFSIYLGDLCINGKYDSWKREFFVDKQLDLIAEVPFFNTIGNHEGWSQNTKTFLQAPFSKSEKPDYYSFDYGDIHFLILNSIGNCKKNSLQWKYAEDDLKKTDKKWKIVAFHYPAYCAGGHGEDNTMKQITTEILEPNRVDIVLAGHSHFYQRNFVNGIYHFIIGGGGAPLYSPETEFYTQKSAKAHHYAIVKLNGNKLTIKVYDIKNKIIDELELKKK